MMSLVLDTSAVLYWTLRQQLLSKKAAKFLDRTDKILISSISIWEIGIKVQKKKLFLPTSIQDFAERVQSISRVEILPVSLDIWLGNLALGWAHRDPADRTIVATAALRQCALITSDRRILDFYNQAIW